MRVAVCSDVHGNAAALQSVIADAVVAGAEEFWVIGDLVADGPRPADVLDRLRALPDARFVRGNTDRYVLTGDLPDVVRTLESEIVAAASTSFAWTRGALTATGHYDWLAELPVEDRTTLPDGTRVLLVHASPGCDDGPGVQAAMSDQDLAGRGITTQAADLVFVGHTHIPLDRTVNGVRVINLGSVSLPATAERRSMWTLVTADEQGYGIERRFSAYGIEQVCEELDAVHHPAAERLKEKFHREPR